uniref:Uncharacterized protein n=1 Tax=Zea mays TaxID=4577 RepID=A0A804QKY2_MAIZE
MLVHEMAALQLQRRRVDWAHSRPVLALDIAWNVAFAATAAAMLSSSAEESPIKPLHLWVFPSSFSDEAESPRGARRGGAVPRCWCARRRRCNCSGGARTGRTPAPSSCSTLPRTSGRRGPSMLVHEMAALQLQRRRVDWAHSRPVLALDIAWNVAFTAAAAAMLSSSAEESPIKPLHLWVFPSSFSDEAESPRGARRGGAVPRCWCARRRRCNCSGGARTGRTPAPSSCSTLPRTSPSPRRPPPCSCPLLRRAPSSRSDCGSSDSSDADSEDDERAEGRSSYTGRCETMNTLISFLWWIIGFYWIFSGGEVLKHGAPRLYWYATFIFVASGFTNDNVQLVWFDYTKD